LKIKNIKKVEKEKKGVFTFRFHTWSCGVEHEGGSTRKREESKEEKEGEGERVMHDGKGEQTTRVDRKAI